MVNKLKLSAIFLLCIALVVTFGLVSCKTKVAEEKSLKIAYFVSDLSNVFHQAQFAEAKKYAMEEYGAEVFAFDGKSDGNVMTQNIDQIVAQGMDMATLHIWDQEAAKPGVLDAIDKGVVINSFFGPIADTGIPVVRSDEAGISFAMGAEMAEQWMAAHPDTPIVMVQLGWPNHTEVQSGRTGPFVEGVLSVDPTATDLGCQDASAGADAAKQIIVDLVTQHPEVNLIYTEASNLTVGTMAGLKQAGRGTMDNGVPTTEILCSVDFDEVEMKSVYDPDSSLKLSMGLPPLETSHARIDNLFDIYNEEIPQVSDAPEAFAKAYNISFWTMTENAAADWLNTQFGTNVIVEEDAAEEKSLKIAYFVSDLSNVFHQAQFAEAKKYAMEEYGAEVFAFDGKSDGNVMTQNIDQIVAQGMDMATLHIWDQEAAKPGVLDAIDKGVVINSFFGPIADTGIPVVRSDEAGISFAMGAEMAEQWMAAHPDTPIVMVQLGWPNHTEVQSGRTGPFVEGVLSVDPTATDLGCQDASAGADAAKQIIVDLVTQHPEVNLIYTEASNLTVGTMAGLKQAGRGTMDNGVPTTEILCSVDFDEVEMKSVYDPDSSLKLSMGLPPLETSHARIDNLFDIYNEEIPQVSDAPEAFAKAYNISFWTMTRDDAVVWLNIQFGTNVE